MIRKAELSDIKRALEIYDSARRFMRERGNNVQWVNGYPSEELLRADVAKGDLYVMEVTHSVTDLEKVQKGHLCANGDPFVYGVFAFIVGDDPTYRVIDGAWRDDVTPYGTLHRLASDGARTGVLREAVDWAQARMPHLRADTHEANLPMRRCLERAGFVYTGIIHVADGTPRYAYEKTESSG